MKMSNPFRPLILIPGSTCLKRYSPFFFSSWRILVQTMTAKLDGLLKDSAEFYNEYKSSNGTADHELYMNRLRLFFLHTFNAQLGYDAEICGVPEGSECDKNGFFIHPDRETAHLKFAVAAGIDGEEAVRIFRSVDNVHAYS